MRREAISFVPWPKNLQAIKQYQQSKGLNQTQAINHMLRIANIAIKNREWIKEFEIDALPIQDLNSPSDNWLDDMLSAKK